MTDRLTEHDKSNIEYLFWEHGARDLRQLILLTEELIEREVAKEIEICENACEAAER